MAIMSTTLVESSDSTNSRTYTAPGHTIAKPRLVIQKRTVGTPSGQSAQDTISVVYGTADAQGVLRPGRVVMEINVRRPVDADPSDITDALALLREVVASDNFAATVDTQNYLQ